MTHGIPSAEGLSAELVARMVALVRRMSMHPLDIAGPLGTIDLEDARARERAREVLDKLAYRATDPRGGGAPFQGADYILLSVEELRTLEAAFATPLPEAVPADFLSKDEAQIALWRAIEAITIGNKTDDKMILNNLREAGIWLARFKGDEQWSTTLGDTATATTASPAHTDTGTTEAVPAADLERGAAVERIRRYIREYEDAPSWGGPTMYPAPPNIADLKALLAFRDAGPQTEGPGDPVAWVSAGQLANLKPDPSDAGGAEYLPIRHTKAGNFTMPLYATPQPSPASAGEQIDRPFMLAAARAWWAAKMGSDVVSVDIKGDGRITVRWRDADEEGRYTLPVRFIQELASLTPDAGLGVLSKIEAEARRYARMYSQGSDGRNTFVIFADWVASLNARSPASPDGQEGGA